MAKKIKVENMISEMKNPALIGGGILLGFAAQKAVNRGVNSQTVKGLLGEVTTSAIAPYVAPAVALVGGVATYMLSTNKEVKALATGVAASGPVSFVARKFLNKDFLAGIDEDEYVEGYNDQDEYVEGYNDQYEYVEGYEDEDYQAVQGFGNYPVLNEEQYMYGLGNTVELI